MAKTAKVTAVRSCRSWQGQNGTVYYHDVQMDNGDVGSIGKKAANSVKVGDELTYEINGDRIKEVRQFGNNGFGGRAVQRGSNASFALSYAKDLVCAANDKLTSVKDMTEATLMVAGKFHVWLKENEQ